jgi:formylglycine-generating enzyme required for sulfatase activity
MLEYKYTNLDLIVERSGDKFRARSLEPGGGQVTSEFNLPFSSTEIENFILRVGRPRRGIRRLDSPEMEAAKHFGARLFEAIFRGDMYASLRNRLNEAQLQEMGVRIRLLLYDSELMQLPWEYLYNPASNQFFSLSADTPLVRYLDLPTITRPLEVKPPLHLLVMIASPADYPLLDVDREWQNFTTALEPLVRRGLVVVERMENALLLALQRKLRQGTYHIFHFIGHGGFDERAQDGMLLFADEHNRGRPLSGQYLGTLLRDHHSLRLAVLNACEGARTGREDPFAGVAQSLVQMGIPAVIAMQFEITDEAAITFAEHFYGALADGYPVDASLSEARKAIFAIGNDIEWGTPVLFTCTPDGRIFNFPQSLASSPPKEEKPDLESLYISAQSAYWTEKWEQAYERFRMVVAKDPGYKDAAAKLAEAEKQTRLAKWYQDAKIALEHQDWKTASETLHQVTALVPTYRDAGDLLKHSEKQLQLADLYSQAGDLARAKQWSAVVQIFDRIHAIDASYLDPEGWLPTAQSVLAEQARQERLAESYSQALTNMDAGRWEPARDLLKTILAEDPTYHDIEDLLRRAETEIIKQRESEKQNKVTSLFQEAELACAQEDWQTAIEKIQNVLTIKPDHTQAKERLQTAQKAQELANLYSQAQLYQRTKKRVQALDTYRSIQQIDPAYRDVATHISTLEAVLAPKRKLPAQERPHLLLAITKRITALLGRTRLRRITAILISVGALVIVGIIVLKLTGWGSPRVRKIAYVNGVEMVFIPEGSFIMGTNADKIVGECKKSWPGTDCDFSYSLAEEGMLQSITLDAFYIDPYEVTNARYQECVYAGVCQDLGGDVFVGRNYSKETTYQDFPVVNVNWFDANTYCKWRGARLPTEAEWEKATRGGHTGWIYPWGNSISGGGGNFCDERCPYEWKSTNYSDGYNGPAPVGKYSPNDYGLYDMAGNVSEWVSSWYMAYPYSNGDGREDPQSNASYRVLRGGSWNDPGYFMRASYRKVADPDLRQVDYGIRCAFSLSP